MAGCARENGTCSHESALLGLLGGRPGSFPPGARLPLSRQRCTIVRTEGGMATISNTCTHLGCVIATTEIGFDCPCHGSRFEVDGIAGL